MADDGGGSGLLTKANLVVTILLAVLTAYSRMAAEKAEAELKERMQLLEARLKESQEKRAERESVQKVQLEVYQQVVTSLEKNQPQMQKVASALVTNVLDEPLRSGLLQALAAEGGAEVSGIAQRTLRFLDDERAVAQPAQPAQLARAAGSTVKWEDVDYDVFWCEEAGDAARQVAARMVAKMKGEGAKGRLRVRILPKAINARPGYQVTGYQVRANAGEEPQAGALKGVGDVVLGRPEFQIVPSDQPTPWYLSAFVCPRAP